jgi:hypothetical protein
MKLLLPTLVGLSSLGGAYSETLFKDIEVQSQLPNLTLPWGVYEAQVFDDDPNVITQSCSALQGFQLTI